ncbi:histidine phosphatase superfamily [Cyathus striatus]|nr:histidine phosphatase superfamily [Cyathus striatus]
MSKAENKSKDTDPLPPSYDVAVQDLESAGILTCYLAHCVLSSRHTHISSSEVIPVNSYAPLPGSTVVDHFPPTSPTNAYPSYFPSDIGYVGPTPTGVEPGAVATAPSYALHSEIAYLVHPQSYVKDSKKKKKGKKKHGKETEDNDIFRLWGNLAPWYSIPQGQFGVEATPDTPDGCTVKALHLLHRHGARYPNANEKIGGPAQFGERLHKKAGEWKAKGELAFLNNWTYKLGENVLTPFGRQQLFDLGVSFRIRYGFLLENFTKTNMLPVFRTDTMDRMQKSAYNFALGFFGHPFEGQYQQLITIREEGFNNSLTPDKSCQNSQDPAKGDRGLWYVQRWADIYLKHAQKRMQRKIKGYHLTIEDVFTMQQMCVYETVSLGYSIFCELFTHEEWEGFDYAMDLQFWYGYAFGSPLARVHGAGYIQELIARITNTPIELHNSSTNATLDDNPVTFPLGQSLYVDATHEELILSVIAAMNLTTFAKMGSLPYTHIPKDRTFRTSELSPFASNIQFQVLQCDRKEDQIRVIINDGVAPLTGIRGCKEDDQGMCPLSIFISAQRELIASADWEYGCNGNWTIPEGTKWETVTGDFPN